MSNKINQPFKDGQLLDENFTQLRKMTKEYNNLFKEDLIANPNYDDMGDARTRPISTPRSKGDEERNAKNSIYNTLNEAFHVVKDMFNTPNSKPMIPLSPEKIKQFYAQIEAYNKLKASQQGAATGTSYERQKLAMAIGKTNDFIQNNPDIQKLIAKELKGNFNIDAHSGVIDGSKENPNGDSAEEIELANAAEALRKSNNPEASKVASQLRLILQANRQLNESDAAMQRHDTPAANTLLGQAEQTINNLPLIKFK
jgi:hypothetical protein